MASTLMYLFHKLMLEERIDPKDPALHPVTVGSVLTRFGCMVLVKMNKIAVATQLLLSHQLSFGINGGVRQVIMGCTLALHMHPSFVQIDLDLRNAHTFCSRGIIEEERSRATSFTTTSWNPFEPSMANLRPHNGSMGTVPTASRQAVTCPSTD